MSESTLTADQRRMVTVARRGFTVSRGTEFAAHRAIADLSASGLSLAQIVTALEGTTYAPGKTRVSLIVKTFRAAGDEVTAEDYFTALKAATASNSGPAARAPRAARSSAPTAPTAPSTPTTPGSIDLGSLTALTAEEAVEVVAAIVTASERFTLADRARLAAILSAAATEVAPLVAVAA